MSYLIIVGYEFSQYEHKYYLKCGMSHFILYRIPENII